MAKRQISFCIPLRPEPWKRPGVCNKKFYNPQVHERIAYGLYMRQAIGDQPLLTGPLELTVDFFLARPQKGRKGEIYVTTVPDLSNLLKHLEDSANSILFSDDRLIVSTIMRKLYTDEQQRTQVTIGEL